MKFEPVTVVESRFAVLPWLALLACAVGLLFVPITHDAIWQMWLGRQMLGGAKLYSDIIEVNPPLWFWIGVPLAAIGADPRLTIIGFFIGTTAVALYLIPAKFRLPSLVALLLIPLHDFGQREHFTLIATAPYVFAVADRSRGECPRHPIAIGLLAGIGLCLKPHFLLLPLALEAFAWKQPRLRPETIAMAATVAAYAISIPIFAPAFVTEGLPMVRRFYGPFGQDPDYIPLALAFLFGGVGAVLGRRVGSPESRALVVASLSFLPAVFIQAKGFPYHSIPVRGFLALAVLVELIRIRKSPIADGVFLGAVIFACVPFGVYRNAFRLQMERHLAGVPSGSSIIVLASNPSMGWPMVEEHGLEWRLHAMSAWQINAVVANPSLLSAVRAIYAHDLAKRPDILVIDQRRGTGPVAHALLPPHYLDCYSLRLRTALMESYVRRC